MPPEKKKQGATMETEKQEKNISHILFAPELDRA